MGQVTQKFDEDHAFEYLLKQCEFGPRNPSSDGYYKCLNFMITELEQTADDLIIQNFLTKKEKIELGMTFIMSLLGITQMQSSKQLFLAIGTLVHGLIVNQIGKIEINQSLERMMGLQVSQSY